MNISTIATSLIQATNLVILLENSTADMRKFIAWKKENDQLIEVLSNVQIEGVTVEDTSKIFEHPLETGATIVDHEVFDPNVVSCRMIIANNDGDSLTELEQLYKQGTELKIRANNKVLERVVISGKPFEITSKMFDKTLYTVTFKEALRVTPVYTKLPPKKVTNKARSSRVNSGVKQAKKTSWLKSTISGGRT